MFSGAKAQRPMTLITGYNLAKVNLNGYEKLHPSRMRRMGTHKG